MQLTNEAKALYRKLENYRRLVSGWRESATGAGLWPAVAEYQALLIRLDRICDKALNREFRREDKGI